jgi:hypothetical protein
LVTCGGLAIRLPLAPTNSSGAAQKAGRRINNRRGLPSCPTRLSPELLCTYSVERRLRSGLTSFGFFTAVGLLLSGLQVLVLERARQQVALRHAKPAEPALPPRFARRLLVEKGGKELFLPVEQLDWAEADRNYICLHAGRETYRLRSTLESLVRQLDPGQFARISRSELVNLDRIREMQPWFHGERRITLKDGKELTWTRRFRAQRFLV